MKIIYVSIIISFIALGSVNAAEQNKKKPVIDRGLTTYQKANKQKRIKQQQKSSQQLEENKKAKIRSQKQLEENKKSEIGKQKQLEENKKAKVGNQKFKKANKEESKKTMPADE